MNVPCAKFRAAEVQGDAVTVLVDSCEFSHKIDVARAQAAASAAEQELERIAGKEDPARYREFEAALERARNRISVSQGKST